MGLLKSILIEGWMQGIRTLPIKVIDTSVHQPADEVVDCVWRELAVPSYDLEVAYLHGVAACGASDSASGGGFS